jgi:O-antigen ligase
MLNIKHITLRKNDICWTLLCLAIFFSPLRAYGLFKFGPFVVSLYKLFTLAMILFTFAKLLKGEYKIYRNDFIINLLIILLVYDIISLTYSSRENLAYFPAYFVQQIIILFGYIVIINRKGNYSSLIKSYIFSVFFPAYLGIYQWIGFMRSGEVAHLPFKRFLMNEGLSEELSFGNFRAVGPLQDPSLFGLYLASVAIICIGLILSNQINSKVERTFLLITAIISIICIFMTGSVSSMVNLTAGFLFTLIKLGRNITTFILKLSLSIFVIFIALSFLSYFFNYSAIDVLMNKLTVTGGDNITFHRDEYLKQAWSEFISSPIFGVGFGNLKMVSAHNTYLTFLTQQGIIGFVLNCLLLVFYPFIYNRKYLNNRSNLFYPYVIITCAALFGVLCQLNAYDIMYLIDVTGVIILLVLASFNFARSSKYLK